MRSLAEFEGYLDKFAVTQDDIQRLCIEQQKFHILVASQGTCQSGKPVLKGILVWYELPFTYDLFPWLFIKELYVSEAARGQGVGDALMTELIAIAKRRGSNKIKWEVLTSNINAQGFYKKLGAKAELDWQTFSLALETA